MTPAQAGAVLLVLVTPTDRALAGWQPAVWVVMGRNAVYARPYGGMRLPCGQAADWLGQVLPPCT